MSYVEKYGSRAGFCEECGKAIKFGETLCKRCRGEKEDLPRKKRAKTRKTDPVLEKTDRVRKRRKKVKRSDSPEE